MGFRLLSLGLVSDAVWCGGYSSVTRLGCFPARWVGLVVYGAIGR